MSRKDYVLIAGAINEVRTFSADADHRVIDNVSRTLAQALKSDNSGFDKARFLTAAGVK